MRRGRIWCFGLIIRMPALRLRGLYLAIATLAAHFILLFLARSAPAGPRPEAGLLFTRINGLHSRDALDDLTAVVGPALTAASSSPKRSSGADVQLVDRLLAWLEADRGLHHRISIVALLETAAGIRRAFELASASERTAYMGGASRRGRRRATLYWLPVDLHRNRDADDAVPVPARRPRPACRTR